MKKRTRLTGRFTAIIHREDDLFVALCPELDVASQGKSVEEARLNLKAAVELFLECASKIEIDERLQGETTVTVPVPDHPEVAIGTLRSIIRQSGLARREFEPGKRKR